MFGGDPRSFVAHRDSDCRGVGFPLDGDGGIRRAVFDRVVDKVLHSERDFLGVAQRRGQRFGNADDDSHALRSRARQASASTALSTAGRNATSSSGVCASLRSMRDRLSRSSTSRPIRAA